MFIGEKNRIEISSSRFSKFIENGSLYVDKTIFIEHILQDSSQVLLFTRPRRMGKSLNMDTLATFLDCKQDAAHLFDRLYIKNSSVFNQINKYPVIYLDFVNLDSTNIDNLQRSFRKQILRIIQKIFKPEDLDYVLQEYINDKSDYSPTILNSLIESVADCYNKEPYIIIDEYDKHIMDTLGSPDGDEIKRFIVTALQSTLKGATHFKKAVLTGVTRTTKENLFSGLNNIKVYDLIKPSVYDTDFSLTHDEVLELVPEDIIADVQEWYNNMRVGNALLYNIYSVMSFLSDCAFAPTRPQGYWSMTGSESLIKRLINDKRASDITKMMNEPNFKPNVTLDYRLNMEHLKENVVCSDTSFYTLSVQAGYLSFNPTEYSTHEIFIPNKEAWNVWARLILDYKYGGVDTQLVDIFRGIHDTTVFSKQLTDFASMVLSYYDFKEQAECIYHVFFLGLIHALRYECISNREAGLGRFDILIKARDFNAIIEFKLADSSSDEQLDKEAGTALRQIDDKEYRQAVKNSPLPLYKIGIACHGKKCLVKTVATTASN